MPISSSRVRNYLWHPRPDLALPRKLCRGFENFAFISSPQPTKYIKSHVSHVYDPANRRASHDYEAAFMFPFLLSLPLPLSLILSRSILPFSSSTSAAAAAVVFGRSRKDDALMRNLEVSRPTGCGCRAEQRRLGLDLENIRTDPSFTKQTFGPRTRCTVTLWAGRLDSRKNMTLVLHQRKGRSWQRAGKVVFYGNADFENWPFKERD